MIKVDPESPDPAAITETAAVIKKGRLVIYPTETVYGLGADALSEDAVKRVYGTKGKDFRDPVSIAVSSREMIEEFAELPGEAAPLVEKLLPGPVTLVLHAKPKVPKLLTAGSGKVGVRFPDDRVVHDLVERVGGPITSTSANVSGRPAPATAEEAIRQIGKKVDLVLDAGRCRIGTPSTVVDLTARQPRILREGAVKAEEIREVLGL